MQVDWNWCTHHSLLQNINFTACFTACAQSNLATVSKTQLATSSQTCSLKKTVSQNQMEICVVLQLQEEWNRKKTFQGRQMLLRCEWTSCLLRCLSSSTWHVAWLCYFLLQIRVYTHQVFTLKLCISCSFSSWVVVVWNHMRFSPDGHGPKCETWTRFVFSFLFDSQTCGISCFKVSEPNKYWVEFFLTVAILRASETVLQQRILSRWTN